MASPEQLRSDALRSHVAEIGQSAASIVDDNIAPATVSIPANYNNDLSMRARSAPLVRVHSADPISLLYLLLDGFDRRKSIPYFM